MEDSNFPTILGFIAGFVVGAVIVNYIIFPIVIGHTLTEVLRLLSQ